MNFIHFKNSDFLKLLPGAFLCILILFGYNNKVLSQTQTYTTPGTYSWTVPPCVTSVTVEVWGGGGGGGGALAIMRNSSSEEACSGAGGGGGGGYSTKTFAVTPGETYSVVVGAGGTSGTSGSGTWNGGISVQPSAGGTGGTSSFSGYSINIQATGGTGGGGAAIYNDGCCDPNDFNMAGTAGTGGAGSGGTTNYSGGNGAAGLLLNLSTDKSGGGGGAAGPGGNGGSAPSPGSVGPTTDPPGGMGQTLGGNGGAGKYDNLPTNTSKNGGSGNIIGGAGGGALVHRENYGVEQAIGGAGANGEIILTYTAAAAPTATINNTSGTTELNCNTSSISVTALPAAAYSYAWSGGSTPTTDINNFSTPGTYTVTVSSSAGCYNTEEITITLNNTAPAADAGTTGILTCTATSLNLAGSGGGSYSWSTSDGNIVSGAATASPTIDAVGTYAVTVTAANGCTASDDVVVSLDITPPSADAGTSPGTITCTTNSLSLSGSGGGTYSWATLTGNIVSGANTATPTISAGGAYAVTVTGANGCTASDFVNVSENTTAPDISVSGGTLTCAVLTSDLLANGGGTYIWSTLNGNIVSGANTSTPTVDAAGTYTVTVTSAVNGCTSTGNAIVTANITPPAADAGTSPGIITCTTTSLQLSGSGGGTYSWAASGGGSITAGANTATPTINAGGTYTLTVTAANGCTASDNVIVAQDASVPIADAGPVGTIDCITPSLILSGSGGITYLWSASSGGNISAGANTATPTVDAAGTYTLTVTASNGCSSSDAIVINEDITLPVADAGISGTINCSNTSLNLIASGGGNYSWSASGGGNIVSGASTATPTVDAAGTYTVTVTSANGCSATDDVIVNENTTPPDVNAGPDGILNCLVTSLDLNGSGGGNYNWSASNGGNITSGSNTSTPSIDAAGTYTVTVTAANGCTASDEAVVTSDNVLPTAMASVTDTLDCTVTSLNLSATGGDTYSWSATGGGNITSGANTANPTVDSGGTYTVTVTAANGCTASDDVVVIQEATIPLADAGVAIDTITCTLTSMNLSASGGGTYLWTASSGGNITSGANTATPTIDADGTYTVTVTIGGCSATDSVVVEENITPPSVDAGTSPGIINCTDTTFVLTGTGDGIYLWNTSNGNITAGSNTATPTINSGGTYTLVVTASNGCTASDNVVIVQDNLLPAANAGMDQNICSGETATLNASGGGTYNWSNSATTTSTIVSPLSTTVYTVTVTSANGCSDTDNVTVTVNSIPNAEAGNDQEICSGESAILTASGGGSYLWSNSEVTATTSVNPSSTTVYTVTVTNGGCSDTDNVTVTVNPSATADAGSDQEICEGQNVVITATGGGSYLWNTGDTTAMITDIPAGSSNYSVTVSNSYGCSASDDIFVTVFSTPTVTLTSDPDGIVYIGQIITFTATPNGYNEYNFYVDSTLVQSTSSNIFMSNSLTDGQTVSVMVGDNGCSSNIDSTDVLVRPIPNAFTPDGNGKNDVFAKGLDLTIINRWDQILYEGKDGWDGKYNNDYASPGTYFYIIKIPDLKNDITVLKGSVTLIDNKN